MQSINDKLNHKFQPVELTEQEYVQSQVDYENQREGELNKLDGYNCLKCHNKGYISKVELLDGHYIEVSNKCSCMNVRKAIKSLLNCGLNLEYLSRCKFSNFITEYDWQKSLMEVVKKYINEFDIKNPKWICLGGQTGAGKTMLMSCLFKNLISKKYLTGYYLLWNNESKQLLNYGKKESDKYNERLYELTSCDILYIDDLFKLDNDKSFDSTISLAYEIINNRYMNNKATIITSEYLKEQLSQKDSAIFGRIYEKTDRGKYFIDIVGTEKNYRMKGIEN